MVNFVALIFVDLTFHYSILLQALFIFIYHVIDSHYLMKYYLYFDVILNFIIHDCS